jgi:hypothetical protein
MLIVSAMLFVCGAWAGTVRESVDGARVALVSGDVERAMSLLAQARMSVPNSPDVLDAATVAELVYLEGLAPRVLGAERKRDVEKWRSALTVYPQLQWSRDILDDKGMRAFFEALRAEVQQREVVHTQVPEMRGRVKTYVDGVEHQHRHAVRTGEHVGQVQCPDGTVAGAWTDFSEHFDWLGLCPPGPKSSGPAPSVVADEFALDDEDPRSGPEPITWVPAARSPIAAERIGPVISSKVLWTGAAVGFAVSAGTYMAALNGRAKSDDLSGDGTNSPSELQAQRKSTNALVVTSGLSALAGGGLVFAAAWSAEF